MRGVRGDGAAAADADPGGVHRPGARVRGDVLGSAETGSGKTAAFALPVLQALSREPYGVFAVVLSPARELAQQIADQFSALGARLPTRVCVVVGGADMMRQALALAERPHIVVATPGRLADHLRSSSGVPAVVRRARFLVVDEADRLLDGGFADDLGFVLGQLPGRRQTLLFSATMSGALRRLQTLALREPFVADLAPQEAVVASLTQQYVFVPATVREAYLTYLLRDALAADGAATAIVFTSTCYSCEVLACTLRALDVDCLPLHSQQPQARAPPRSAASSRGRCASSSPPTSRRAASTSRRCRSSSTTTSPPSRATTSTAAAAPRAPAAPAAPSRW